MQNDDHRTIQAFADENEQLHCMKCGTVLHERDVAMFIRSKPTEAFSTWCPTCTLWIMKHASADLGFSEEAVVLAFF